MSPRSVTAPRAAGFLYAITGFVGGVLVSLLATHAPVPPQASPQPSAKDEAICESYATGFMCVRKTFVNPDGSWWIPGLSTPMRGQFSPETMEYYRQKGLSGEAQ